MIMPSKPGEFHPEPLMPKGRKSERADDRKIMNAIFYSASYRCAWRDLQVIPSRRNAAKKAYCPKRASMGPTRSAGRERSGTPATGPRVRISSVPRRNERRAARDGCLSATLRGKLNLVPGSRRRPAAPRSPRSGIPLPQGSGTRKRLLVERLQQAWQRGVSDTGVSRLVPLSRVSYRTRPRQLWRLVLSSMDTRYK
jgi:transposase